MFQRAGAAWRLAAKRMDNPNRSQAVIVAFETEHEASYFTA